MTAGTTTAPELAHFCVEWGPNQLDFATRDEVVAFAQEQGSKAVSYWAVWLTAAYS